MQPVAILCVHAQSIYRSLDHVECYDAKRDVRSFPGGMPVVCHPPCRSWSAFCAHQAKPPPGEKELGPLCVDHLKREGGILEHPAHSRLFAHCGLPTPGEPEREGLWTAEVWQAWWGYPMMKKTWLCFSGIPKAAITFPYTLHPQGQDRRRQQLMSHNQRAATHPAFAQWLVTHARLSTPSLITHHP